MKKLSAMVLALVMSVSGNVFAAEEAAGAAGGSSGGAAEQRRAVGRLRVAAQPQVPGLRQPEFLPQLSPQEWLWLLLLSQ